MKGNHAHTKEMESIYIHSRVAIDRFYTLAGGGEAKQTTLVQIGELLASLITAGAAFATADLGRAINGLACCCDEASWEWVRGSLEVAVKSMPFRAGVVKEVKGWADGCKDGDLALRCRLIGMVRRLAW